MLKILLIFVIFHHGANCAMRKSWKSAPNFDDEVPQFTPFDDMKDIKKVEENIKKVENFKREVKIDEIRTTEAVTQPSPSAETIKISSKFKMPSKIIEILKDEPKEKGFGKFAYEVPESSSEEDSNEVEESVKLSENEEDDDENFEITSNNNSTQLKVGQLVNVTVNPEDNTVNVNLDGNSIKEIFQGRGKRIGILERIVPLFVLPFIIQSAIVPFIVTSIKLLLIKSLFAGKIAILFLLLGALRSHQHSMYMKSFATQQQPFLHRDYPIPFLPERRAEIFDGYKADGKPEAFIN